ncbi:MAG: methyl-accepting chemotaxis protein [Caulobacterales bacterium]
MRVIDHFALSLGGKARFFQSLNQKALLGGGAVFALVALSGAAGVWAAVEASDALRDSRRDADLLRTHTRAGMLHDALRSDVLAALVAAEPASGVDMTDVMADMRAHAGALRESVAREVWLASPEFQPAVAELEAPLSAYVQSAEEIVNAAAVDPAAARTMLPQYLAHFRELERAMARVSDDISGAADVDAAHATSDAQTSIYILTALLVISASAAAFLVFALRRLIVEPVNDVANAMQKLAAGDDMIDPPHINRTDEIGVLGRALAQFKSDQVERARVQKQRDEAQRAAVHQRRQAEQDAQARNEEVVTESFGEALSKLAAGDLSYRLKREVPAAYLGLQTDFNAAMDKLSEAMGVISSNASGMRTGAREISQAADDLSRRTEQQAATLEETAAALDQITATVRKTAEGAAQANNVVMGARAEAERSGKVVTDAVAAMSEIEKSAKQISQIIGVIDEIAFQTNLLALNAGVEAARAGEAGRGFAVVAQEVRALAQRSSGAAKEIKTLITASANHVERGVTLVGETGEVLTGIVRKVADISHLVAEISLSAQEQATGLAQVNTAINQMDQVTQQNAAMVEESTAASHSLSQEAEALTRLVARFEGGESPRIVPVEMRAPAPIARPVSKSAPVERVTAARPSPRITTEPPAIARPRLATAASAPASNQVAVQQRRIANFAASQARDDWEEF